MVLVPILIGIFPGIKLNAVTALIPILNISLATKEIIAGTISAWVMAEVYLVLFSLTVMGLIFCARWFNREEIIFRGV